MVMSNNQGGLDEAGMDARLVKGLLCSSVHPRFEALHERIGASRTSATKPKYMMAKSFAGLEVFYASHTMLTIPSTIRLALDSAAPSNLLVFTIVNRQKKSLMVYSNSCRAVVNLPVLLQ